MLPVRAFQGFFYTKEKVYTLAQMVIKKKMCLLAKRWKGIRDEHFGISLGIVE